MKINLLLLLFLSGLNGLMAQWDKVYKAKEGIRLVMKQEKYGFIDQSDQLITEIKYEDAFDFKNGFAMVKSNGKFGFIDKTGKEIINCKYDKAFNFGGGYAKVYLKGKIAYINESEDYFWLATPFEKSYKPKEGLALLMNKGKYAYCNKDGNLITGYDFDDAFDFRDGMGLVKIGDKMGFVDNSGLLKIPAVYDKAESFKGAKAKIIKDGRTGFVNKDGTETFGYVLGQYLKEEGGNSDNSDNVNSSNYIKIKMLKKGGVWTIPCKVNGLDFNFIFDTGASEVFVSVDVLTVMLKQGTVTDDDLLGTSSFTDASGNVNIGIDFNIKEIVVGGIAVKNVKASSSRNINSPLLLGQTFLERFPKITQDNNGGYLIITK